jgi:hypothetical protein
MSESALGSSVFLAVVAFAALLLARWLCALKDRKILVALVVLCVAGAGGSIFTVDVNIPLSASHLRPSGEPAPIWLALLAWLFRLLPLFIPLVLSVRRLRARPAEGTHG